MRDGAARLTVADIDQPKEGEMAETIRERLLSGVPVSERRLDLAGVRTAVLEGGNGPPVVLLHEQGTFAAHWVHLLPSLTATNRVIAPDLPGHGDSAVEEGVLDADLVLEWLDRLIESTCESPAALVGHMGGGAIAARYATASSDRLRSLVLVDSFGLGKFRPSPLFALALFRYVARPTRRTYNGLMQRCTVDYDGVRADLGDRWESYEAYALDRARDPGGKAALRAIMRDLAVPPIPPDELERIEVPTTLIWGRQDPVNRLRVAEAASARFHWPLRVIEEAGDDPPIEQPEALLRALREAI